MDIKRWKIILPLLAIVFSVIIGYLLTREYNYMNHIKQDEIGLFLRGRTSRTI